MNTLTEAPARPISTLPSRLLAVEMARTLFRLWLPLAGLLSATAAAAALSPSFAWLTKRVVAAIEAGVTDPWRLLPEFVPFFLAISIGLVAVEFGEKILNKVVEYRLIIAMQRSYLEKRQKADVSQDVAHVLYGSDVAKKGFQVIYKDSWKIVTVVTSVLLWQLSIGAQWLPVLVVSALPTIFFVWFFGSRISHRSREILDLQSRISEATGSGERSRLHHHQERFVSTSVRLHILKWLAEDASDIVMWTSFAAVAAIAYVLGIGPSVKDISLAELSALAVNLKLLAKPLGDIGRVYTRWQEAHPALIRSLVPASEQP
ncbi:MAG: hypothetical protein ACK4KV_14685 [Rhodocyclaceae bacterium]